MINGEDDLSEKKEGKNWLAKQAEREAKKDKLSSSDRAGQGVGVFFILVVLWFFFAHQVYSTGFFTSGFASVEAFFFYTPPILGIVASISRMVIGRKNAVRPLDILGLGLVFVAFIWLFTVFPFDFSHLADVLPDFLRFLLLWISNDIAKLVMVLGIVGTLFATVFTAALYVFVRRELSKS